MSDSDPRQCGLWAAVARGGEIKPGAWMNAQSSGEVIGTCRACGGYLVPDDPPTYGERLTVQWFTARCLECGHEVAAPDGRVLHRSGRAGERARS